MPVIRTPCTPTHPALTWVPVLTVWHLNQNLGWDLHPTAITFNLFCIRLELVDIPSSLIII
eukprot:12107727-Heterocapsa_arctica.AAC.1